MPTREWNLRIEDILEAIDDIAHFTRGMSFDAFSADKKTVKAVLYSIAVIGEAARQVPAEVQKQNPEIPWREMADIRNVIVHEYFGIDLDILWAAITVELPPLVSSLRRMLK